MIKERVRREREKYKDYDTLKGKAAKVDAAEEANKSELEKAQEKLAAVQRERDTLAQATNDRLIRMETRVQAATLGFVNPDDAYHLADVSGISIDDEGNVKGVAEALAELAKVKPYLLKPDAPRPTPPRTDTGVGNPPTDLPGLTPGEEMLMREAAAQGITLDPEAIKKRKQQARVTTASA
jgi:hypothetical protein